MDGIPKLSSLVLSLWIGAYTLAAPSTLLAAESSKLNVTGEWRVDIEHKRRRCRWQGRVHLDQNDTRLTGSGEAAASAGQRLCPRLKGKVEGSVNGRRVKFGFATGKLGTGKFDGELAPGGRKLSGTWAAGSAAGTWRAERLN